MRDLAERWMRSIPGLRGPGMRIRLVQADLAERSPGDIALALEVVCQAAEQADERAREVLTALAPVLADPAADALVDAIRDEAHAESHLALARLLRRRPARQLDAPAPGQRGAPDLRVGRPLSLGERKALARRQDRFSLDRLLRDPHPAVIRNVLTNPRITEEDVLRLAARRPTFADVQVEIATSPRWSIRPRVRAALVQNPFTPPSIAVPLVSLLVRGELAQVVAATDIPAVVRGVALELLERRPPIQSDDDPSTMQ